MFNLKISITTSYKNKTVQLHNTSHTGFAACLACNTPYTANPMARQIH